ncbi:unnamed protein product, partial [Rotaria sordida]
MQGIILGAYFWGYIITQIRAGYLAGRFGPRFLFGGAIIVSSLVIAFMPIVASVQAGSIFALSIGGLMCSWHFAGGWPLIFYSA